MVGVGGVGIGRGRKSVLEGVCWSSGVRDDMGLCQQETCIIDAFAGKVYEP